MDCHHPLLFPHRPPPRPPSASLRKDGVIAVSRAYPIREPHRTELNGATLVQDFRSMEAPQFHSIFPSPMFSGAWNGFFFAWITCMVFFLTWNPLLSEMVFF